MAGPYTWGEMAKAAGDPTSIDDAIAAALAAHNASDNAHGQSNEAIYNHRIADILDHIDQSITTPKYSDFSVSEEKILHSKFYFTTMWETIDAWVSSSSNPSFPKLEIGMCTIATDNVNGHTSYIIAQNSAWECGFADSNPVIDVLIYFSSLTNRHIYIGMGKIDEEFAGFKIDGNTLYTCIIL